MKNGKPEHETIDDCIEKLGFYKKNAVRLAESMREIDYLIYELNNKISSIMSLTQDDGRKTATTSSKSIKKKIGRSRKTPVDAIEKACTRCHETKPLTEFSLSKTSKDGHHSYCKSCRCAIAKETHKTSSEPLPHTSGGDAGGLTPGQQAPTPPETARPPVVWTKDQDSIIKKNFGELGVSGIYLRNLLPKQYSLTDIKTRCITLKLLDSFGNRPEKHIHRKSDEDKSEPYNPDEER